MRLGESWVERLGGQVNPSLRHLGSRPFWTGWVMQLGHKKKDHDISALSVGESETPERCCAVG